MPKKNEMMVRDKLPLKFFTQPDLTSCSITCLAYAFGLYYYNDYDNSSVIREYCRLDLAFLITSDTILMALDNMKKK